MKGLWKWGVDKAQGLAAKVEEVVAPVNNLPPEQLFERRWTAVIDYYHHIQATDKGDPLSADGALAGSNIMPHLDKMLELVKDEERTMSRTMREGDVGPCMTVLLQKKVVDCLCAFGQADRPVGMMVLVIRTIQELLEATRPGLLDHHAQVTEPMHKLIQHAAKGKNSASISAGLIHLIETIFKKIRLKPELLEHVVTRSVDGSNRIVEFFMFSTVVKNINDPDTTGVYARGAAVECFKIVQEADLSEFIADTTSFCADVASGLAHAYGTVLQLGEARLEEAERFGAADYLRQHVTFIGEIGKYLHHPVLMRELTTQLSALFFGPIVAKSITDTAREPAAAAFAIQLVRYLVSQLGPSEILTTLCHTLLGPSEQSPEEPAASMAAAGEEEGSVQQVLLSHLRGEDVTARQASLQLFDGLLETREECVVQLLLLRNVSLWDAGGAGGADLKDALVAHAGAVHMDEKALSDYHAEAEQQLYKWECYLPGGNSDKMWPCLSPDGVPPSPLEAEATPADRLYEGSFLREVLRLVRGVLQLDAYSAMFITGIVTRLAQCPDPRLHKFVLDTQVRPPLGGESLPSIIVQVCREVDQLLATTPDAERACEQARTDVEERRPATQPQVEKMRPVVVWQEFVKEIVATIEMKRIAYPDLP